LQKAACSVPLRVKKKKAADKCGLFYFPNKLSLRYYFVECLSL